MNQHTRTSGLEILSAHPETAQRDVPLLFVHGAFAGAWCWEENFLPYFAGLGYRAYAVSLRGHGGSGGAERLSSAGMEDYVEDVAAAARALGEVPVLVGHSMGGAVVERYVARHPALAAVLLASVPPHGLMPSSMRLAWTDPALYRELNLIQHAHPHYATLSGMRRALFSDDMDEATLRRYFGRAQSESHRAIFDLMFGNGWLRRRELPPVLVMGGADDRLFTPDEVRATARAFGTEAVLVPGVAHGMMLDTGWERVARHIAGWLDEQGL